MIKHDLSAHKLLFFILIGVIEVLVFCGCKPRSMSEKEASQAFRNYVLNPIPKSVTNIRADQPKKFRGYRYTFRFNINREDLGLIINSGPFVKVWHTKYENGALHWKWDRGTGPLGLSKYSSEIPCYDHTVEPPWFKLGQWDEPEAYAFRKKGDLLNIETIEKESSGPMNIKVLLYNENDAEAYFVVTYWEK
jgi:hypothetical protein